MFWGPRECSCAQRENKLERFMSRSPCKRSQLLMNTNAFTNKTQKNPTHFDRNSDRILPHGHSCYAPTRWLRITSFCTFYEASLSVVYISKTDLPCCFSNMKYNIKCSFSNYIRTPPLPHPQSRLKEYSCPELQWA